MWQKWNINRKDDYYKSKRYEVSSMHITTYSISNSLREDVKQYGTTWVSKKDLPKEFQDNPPFLF